MNDSSQRRRPPFLHRSRRPNARDWRSLRSSAAPTSVAEPSCPERACSPPKLSGAMCWHHVRRLQRRRQDTPMSAVGVRWRAQVVAPQRPQPPLGWGEARLPERLIRALFPVRAQSPAETICRGGKSAVAIETAVCVNRPGNHVRVTRDLGVTWQSSPPPFPMLSFRGPVRTLTFDRGLRWRPQRHRS